MKPDAPSVSDLVRDDTMAPWALFHRRAKGRQGVYANLHDWADSVDGRQWQWYTLWNPLELEAFDDVWIIGNCFTQTVTFKLLSEFYGDRIEFVPFSLGAGETWERRKLTLRYFTSSHVAGSGFWSRAEGKECVRRWADWVRANSQDERHYWTANEDQLKTSGTRCRATGAPRRSPEAMSSGTITCARSCTRPSTIRRMMRRWSSSDHPG